MNALIRRWNRVGAKTAAAGTPIVVGLDPAGSFGRIIIQRLSVACGATAETLTVMQVLGKDKVTALAAAGQKILKIAEANALGIAANDYLGLQLADGRIQFSKVTAVGAAVDGEIPVTVEDNLLNYIEANSGLFYFGAPADGHEQETLAANATTVFEAEYGYFGANEKGHPILLHINNITNAATLKAVVFPTIDA